ncbi:MULTISPECIES: UDP-N-acetylmuramoyl-tripeptide--D-alanyl-D-alanine ligase [unclassified Ruegeria]|uniref:UDP-N-acetylmuramoyl-tripeptide--D-alanyl-D- alanine ligase n=1 Tax=unclassified Ruegeria TaxID=2625375 RepID=UPI0014891CA2|nr:MULTISPECIES: UDP-N-acetylmuramoyl-tripeptide--D-alanyl-D-alanine ligase [unclassified Ruegeria]NOD74735.1 UDP-N-acetylmuramoyl-tripeptide--D-alanyl-D-alanine ligase [Ruegeria sp. HKCCD4332]NOD88532.1 UDP-N-acetylmuramoyl-tripeptide--D-alanyl-D-alanine ligase [Ruegeria sp. HKCCD4318]NOE12240.1 UDP-N-acetylmuramoyl-tripeptide--D-alanyl-D-alanine ligase [Ruegeria sp. HKCCD4318-2]NOG09595.1 UDP-N-acetylmuramoyl-tripeptide--D-alanyl-D-alanine ligase [Ruegeria sp. HKCCD4315]
MTLWTASEAAEATGGQGTRDWIANGVSIDTRTLQPGDLFVALKAARDGHDFVAQALERGAGAALVSRIPDDVPDGAPLLIVEDVQAGLEALGQAARARTDARVVGVTGSVGKTSTKEMLATILETQGKTHASVASYNNHWGVPLTLARMPRDTEFAVIEIGMNHPGEIAPLAKQARPHVALVTTVAAVHLEAFESVAGIAHEKAAIFEGLEPGGAAIVNADIKHADILRQTALGHGTGIVDFGRKASDYRLTDVQQAANAVNAQAVIGDYPIRFDVNSAGTHFAMNALGALAACVELGVDLDQAIAGLRAWSPVKGRGVRENLPLSGGGQIELLDDSYNANPTSMEAALDVLAASQGTRRIAFLGDMKELGSQEVAMHAEMANVAAMGKVNQVHCIGPLMQAMHKALPDDKRGLWFETSAEMAEHLPALINEGDTVLAKGSLSMALATIVDGLRKMGQGSALDG